MHATGRRCSVVKPPSRPAATRSTCRAACPVARRTCVAAWTRDMPIAKTTPAAAARRHHVAQRGSASAASALGRRRLDASRAAAALASRWTRASARAATPAPQRVRVRLQALAQRAALAPRCSQHSAHSSTCASMSTACDRRIKLAVDVGCHAPSGEARNRSSVLAAHATPRLRRRYAARSAGASWGRSSSRSRSTIPSASACSRSVFCRSLRPRCRRDITGADRAAHGVGNLLVRELLDVGQDDREPELVAGSSSSARCTSASTSGVSACVSGSRIAAHRGRANPAVGQRDRRPGPSRRSRSRPPRR